MVQWYLVYIMNIKEDFTEMILIILFDKKCEA
jgi:hypothetical protein